MNIIWRNIAGSGQVYAQREGDASVSDAQSSLKVGQVGTAEQQNILKAYTAKRGRIQDISYLIFSLYVLFPLELLFFLTRVSGCLRQTGPTVSQKFKTSSWLYNTSRLTETKSGNKITERLGWAISIPELCWKVPGKDRIYFLRSVVMFLSPLGQHKDNFSN